MEPIIEFVEGAIRLPLTVKGGELHPSNAQVELLDAKEMTQGGTGPFGRTLRIALAMKGGVSLAVWIGGAVAELDVLRRIRLRGDLTDPYAVLLATWAKKEKEEAVLSARRDLIRRATVYAQLLASRGYDAVEFDVLAGASAGGLNAVMYGVAQRAGVTTDRILDTWQESGDIWNLLRGRGVRSIDSVLRGDGYLWPAMLRALEELYRAPHHGALVAPVSVDLSATVIDGEESFERGTREGKAHFHFSGGTDTETPGRIIPGVDVNRREADTALKRLAYAARTTSSFPGAFEPAKIYSGEGAASPDSVDMRDAFHAHRKTRGDTLDPFRVVDGGVTDNVPIDRALRAIRNRPADHYVNRALVYLDPSPKLQFDGLIRPTEYHGRPPDLPQGDGQDRYAQDGDGQADAPDPRSAFLGVIFTSLGRMLGRESKDDEVEDVERFRRALFLEQGKDELFAPITEEPISRPGGGQPVHVSRAYARFRSVADLDQLMEVLLQPSLWQLTTRSDRAEHRGWSREDLRGLERAFLNKIGRELSDSELEGVCTGYQAVVDACRCMISWVRAIEDGAFWSGGGIATLDRTIWAGAGAVRNRRDLRAVLHDELQGALLDRDNAIMHVLTRTDQCAPRNGYPVKPKVLAGAAVEAWLEEGNVTPGTDSRWHALDSVIHDLRAVSLAFDKHEDNSPEAVETRQKKPGNTDGRLRTTDWAQSPWSGIGRTQPTFKARDLAPLVAARGMPMAMPAMRYEDITAAETRRDPGAYWALMEAQMISGYRSLLKLSLKDAKQLAAARTEAQKSDSESDEQPDRVSESVRRLMPTDKLRPHTKLAGMGLANFAGFLSGEWRTNDWWWGRLDAAQGAIDVLESILPWDPIPAPADARQDVEAAVLDEWRLARDGNDHSGREKFQSSIGTNIAGTTSLKPNYRVAVASRLVRLASQAIIRGTTRLAPQRIALWLLRPLLVFLPAFLDPVRIAIVAALIVASQLLAVRDHQPASLVSWIAAVSLCILSITTVVVSFAEKLRRKYALEDAIDENRMKCVRAAVQKAMWVGAGYAVATLITVVSALWILAATQEQGPLVWVMLGAALIFALVARSQFLVPKVPSGQKRTRSLVAVVVAIAIVVLAWLPGVAGEWPEIGDADWRLVLIAAMTGFAVAIALTLGWLTGFAKQSGAARHSRFPRLSGLGVLVATALLCGLATGAPFAIPVFGQQSWASPAIPAVLAFWAWGTTLWWVPAWLQPEYAPSDAVVSRASPKERQLPFRTTGT